MQELHPADRFEDPHRLRGDLFPYAVSGDDRDALSHEVMLSRTLSAQSWDELLF
jgi:hypothetical protein